MVVRCRPLNHREKSLNSKTVLTMELDRCQCFIEKPGAVDEPPKQFTFDGTYCMDQTTEQLYNEIAYPLVEVSCVFNEVTRHPGSQTSHYLLTSVLTLKQSCVFFHRESQRATTAQYLPTDKLEVANLSPCRACWSLQPRGASSHELLNTSLRASRSVESLFAHSKCTARCFMRYFG